MHPDPKKERNDDLARDTKIILAKLRGAQAMAIQVGQYEGMTTAIAHALIITSLGTMDKNTVSEVLLNFPLEKKD